MPSGGPSNRHPPMSAEREVVRFLSAVQRAWLDAFPGMHRRAQPQIIAYLASDDGAFVTGQIICHGIEPGGRSPR